jgi:MFS family permease
MLPIAMLGIMATSPGQTFVVSVFNPSFREELGLSHSQLTSAYMAGTFLAALAQPYVGRLVDRFGNRRLMAAVVLAFGLACLFTSRTSSLLMLFAAFLLLRMLGQGALSLVSSNTVAMWFQQRLGTVSGFMSVGFSVAIALLPPGILVLIQEYGWRNAYVILGVAVWVSMFPLLAFLYHNHPADVGQRLDGVQILPENLGLPVEGTAGSVAPDFDLREARRSRSYWIMVSASAAWGMIATGVYFNIIPLFAESGHSEAAAAATFTLLSITMGAAQISGGYIADRVPLNWLASASMTFLSIGVVVLINLESIGIWQLYPVFFGLGQGLIGVVGSTVWVRYYGRKHLGKIRGSIFTFTIAGTSLGPFVMGVTFDRFGSYRASLLIFLLLLIPIALAALLATPPKKPAAPGPA